MKLPELKRTKSKPGTTRQGLQPPKIFGDLYADLRDRRLLPLVALLVVAIAAVPFLLGETDKSVPEVPPVQPAKTRPEASFSVVPASVGLRAYRKRLGYRVARDPFASGAEKNKSSSQSRAKESSEGSASVESGATESVESAVAEPLIPSSESSNSGEADSTTTKANVVVKNQVIGYGVNASLGFIGHVKPRKEIAPMTKLPSPKNPVVVYVGPNDANTGAIFLMTNNVSAFYGGGRCKLGGQVCQLLELKAGKSATFAYGYGEARYKVYLNKVVPLVTTEKIEANVTKHSHGGGKGGP
jgi:hypothetical protein